MPPPPPSRRRENANEDDPSVRALFARDVDFSSRREIPLNRSTRLFISFKRRHRVNVSPSVLAGSKSNALPAAPRVSAKRTAKLTSKAKALAVSKTTPTKRRGRPPKKLAVKLVKMTPAPGSLAAAPAASASSPTPRARPTPRS